jgi:predicted RecA/RadA family phage recombinase
MVTGMINSLKGPEKQDTTGLAAAQNPAYKSIEALGKDMALSAAIATGGGGQKKSQEQQAEEMIAALQAIQNGEANNAMVEAINKLPAAIAQAIKQGIGFEGKDTLDAAANMSRAWMPSMITNAGDALGDAVGSAMEYVWG